MNHLRTKPSYKFLGEPIGCWWAGLIEPMKKVARMLRKHEDLLLNHFRAKRQYTNAMVEGMNHKARVSLARSFGHRSFEVLKLVLYHNIGDLPEPPCSHRFC